MDIKNLSPEQQAEVLRKAQILDELIELRGMATRGDMEPIVESFNNYIGFGMSSYLEYPGNYCAAHVFTCEIEPDSDDEEAEQTIEALTEIMNRLEELK